jgi:hypothetical protein
MTAPTIWQQLGAKIYTGANLTDTTIEAFKGVGGAWVTATIYNDTNVEDANRALIPEWRSKGLVVGGMFNGLGGDPHADAANIAALVAEYTLPIVILDLEGPYQYPEGDATLMPILVQELVRRLGPVRPGFQLAVNTNGLNNSMIWNGRTLLPVSPRQSFWRLGVRVEPQWYNAPIYEQTWADPVYAMTWLAANQPLDSNFHDPTQQFGRAVPLSFVHGCFEFTGVEGADLATALPRAVEAQAHGFTKGISLFPLERAPASDWPILAQHRGQLYL